MPRKKKEEVIDVTPETTDIVPYEDEQQHMEIVDRKRELLAREREIKALEARMKDIAYIEKIDSVTEKLMDKLLEGEKLGDFLDRMLEKGSGKDLQAIMISLGISLDKREKLLQYDEIRQKQSDKKTKFQFVFKNADGSQAGVSVTTE